MTLPMISFLVTALSVAALLESKFSDVSKRESALSLYPLLQLGIPGGIYVNLFLPHPPRSASVPWHSFLHFSDRLSGEANQPCLGYTYYLEASQSALDREFCSQTDLDPFLIQAWKGVGMKGALRNLNQSYDDVLRSQLFCQRSLVTIVLFQSSEVKKRQQERFHGGVINYPQVIKNIGKIQQIFVFFFCHFNKTPQNKQMQSTIVTVSTDLRFSVDISKKVINWFIHGGVCNNPDTI